MIKSPDELLKDELVCFHTKASIRETTLGIGITTTRIPRTGEIQTVKPTVDLISLKAFSKLNVRHSAGNEKFDQWLPLYFGETDTIVKMKEVQNAETKEKELKPMESNGYERFKHLIHKSMSFICTGSTRREFNSDMVLQVMPKLIVSHVAAMMEEKRHLSIVALRRLVNFVRLFRLLINWYPEIEEKMKERIAEFLNSPENRVKSKCPDIGALLAMVTVSSKYSIHEILIPYMEEQLDR